MDTDYRTVKPEGQFDQYSCWAACLTWWLRAVKDGRPSWSQSQIITEFDKYTDFNGGFAPADILKVWPQTSSLKISGGVFRAANYRVQRLPLGEKPVIIAFTYPAIGGAHMNVLFNHSPQVNARNLTAMEPYHPYPGMDGKRTGQIVDRTVDFYVKDSTDILLFWPTVVFT